MNINPERLETEVRPALKNSRTKYEEAYETLVNLYLPSDCDYSYKARIINSLENILSKVGKLVNETNDYISDLGGANDLTEESVASFGEIVGDTVVVAGVSIFGGIVSFFEECTDGVLLLGTQIVDLGLIAAGEVVSIFDSEFGKQINETGATLLQDVMIYVEADQTNNLMDTIKNTEWALDKYDDSLIKSGSGAESILMSVGYAIPSFFIGKYVPSGKMITSALVTQGNSVEKALSNQKDNSLSRVDDAYEKGYILPEVYAHREEIMNYTDEEYYQNIRQSYINGTITEREYNDYEKIRSMNWTTRDNAAITNMAGVTTGIVSMGVAELATNSEKYAGKIAEKTGIAAITAFHDAIDVGGTITGAAINSIMINAVSDEFDPDLVSATQKGVNKEQNTLIARATKATVTSVKNRTGLSGTNGFVTQMGSVVVNGLVTNTVNTISDMVF